jgi:hypothetical protein
MSTTVHEHSRHRLSTIQHQRQIHNHDHEIYRRWLALSFVSAVMIANQCYLPGVTLVTPTRSQATLQALQVILDAQMGTAVINDEISNLTITPTP